MGNGRIGTFEGIKIFQATPTKQDLSTNLVPRAFSLSRGRVKDLATRLSWYLVCRDSFQNFRRAPL